VELKKVLEENRLALGTMVFGWKTSYDEALNLFKIALDNNIKLIDTSVSYGQGKSHEIIGECLQKIKNRHFFYIATKVGGNSGVIDQNYASGYRFKTIINQCNLSLKQLKTDYIDLLQLHYPTEEVSYEEMYAALLHLKKVGKVKRIGVSNYLPEDISDFERSCNIKNGYLSNQIEVNILKQDNLINLKKNKIKRINLAYALLCGGILKKQIIEDKDFIKKNLYNRKDYQYKYYLLQQNKTKQKLELLTDLSHKLNIDPLYLAIIWVYGQKEIDGIILGPSNQEQLKDLLKIISYEVKMEILNEFNDN